MHTSNNNSDYINSLAGLIAIDSTAGVNVSTEYPYGEGPAKALEYVLNMCRDFGMVVVNRDGKVGYVEIGHGKEIVGILAHLDVVPAGNGWIYPPFELTETENRLYGRGVTDDKGPLMACIFAMKDVVEKRCLLKRRVRLILGQTEETGEWKDIEYYCENEEMPVFGFTPDADFPAIFGEKGIAHFKLSMNLADSGFKYADGGTVANMVPDSCRIVLRDGTEFSAIGKSAHASLLESGINAISETMEQIEKSGNRSRFVDFYQRYIGKTLYGELGLCALEDKESGKLTLNTGLLKTDGDNLSVVLDIRYPVTFKIYDVEDHLKAAAIPYGIEVERLFTSEPVYMDKGGEVIKQLLAVYRKATGDYADPMVIGGGTYARSMPNIIAFGPMFPERERTEHQKDEYILKDDYILLREIYREAIKALANI